MGKFSSDKEEGVGYPSEMSCGAGKTPGQNANPEFYAWPPKSERKSERNSEELFRPLRLGCEF